MKKNNSPTICLLRNIIAFSFLLLHYSISHTICLQPDLLGSCTIPEEALLVENICSRVQPAYWCGEGTLQSIDYHLRTKDLITDDICGLQPALWPGGGSSQPIDYRPRAQGFYIPGIDF